MSKCEFVGKDGKCNTIMAWIELECPYCGEPSPIRDYHTTMTLIKPYQVFVRCPKCDHNSRLESINLEKQD